jgi:DNA-binding MarR family transcriptional regulator
LSAWWKLSQALKRRVAPRLENEYGVRFKHFLVLTNISRGHRSPGALAETLGFPPSEVSRVLDVLSRKGLVRREVDPEDLRRMKLELTPAGDAVLAGMNGSMSKLFQRDVAGCVPRSRLERLAAALDIACELSEDP